eukprot:scaffold11712_cov102-Isochrysis_galbana.AAC.1
MAPRGAACPALFLGADSAGAVRGEGDGLLAAGDWWGENKPGLRSAVVGCCSGGNSPRPSLPTWSCAPPT